MMHAMGCDPKNRAPFQRHCTAKGKEILQPFRCFIRPVGMKAVVTKADTKANANPIKYDPYDNSRSRDVKECSYRADVEEQQDDRRQPVYSCARFNSSNLCSHISTVSGKCQRECNSCVILGPELLFEAGLPFF